MEFKSISDSDFYKKLINSLPGIFYLYEKLGDQVFLRMWNVNHEKDLEYSKEKLHNMNGSEFFTKTEFKRIAKGIVKVFNEGTIQIKTKIVTKSGKQIPYLLEAFSFVDNDRHYIMGVGIDITPQLNIESDLTKSLIRQNILKQDNIKIAEQLENKKRELISTALDISKTNKLITYTINELNKLIKTQTDLELKNSLRKIHNKLKFQSKKQDNWEVFKLRFNEIHSNFFNNLLCQHSNLTKSEIRFCAYLYIRLSSDQIGTILNVSSMGIKKTRYRIRKKIGLNTKDSLDSYILNI